MITLMAISILDDVLCANVRDKIYIYEDASVGKFVSDIQSLYREYQYYCLLISSLSGETRNWA